MNVPSSSILINLMSHHIKKSSACDTRKGRACKYRHYDMQMQVVYEALKMCADKICPSLAKDGECSVFALSFMQRVLKAARQVMSSRV